jgi:ABC-2 type transport system permease protein
MPHETRFGGGSAAPGQGGLAALSLFGGGVLGAALCVPVLVLLVALHVTGRHGLLWLVLPAGLAYGAGLAAAGLRFAAPRLTRRLPEILASVSRG